VPLSGATTLRQAHARLDVTAGREEAEDERHRKADDEASGVCHGPIVPSHLLLRRYRSRYFRDGTLRARLPEAVISHYALRPVDPFGHSRRSV
jgi:hypothetical protein